MYDPISQDSPHDADFPATMSEFEMVHADALLNGVIYQPAGEGAHPLIILLHGIPGHERNFDLAQILRRAGWAVCVFHYRGSWGSGGDYRFTHILEDVVVVLDYFRESAIAEKYQIDPERMMTVGHSLGGWASLMTAASGAVDTAVSISGANVGVWQQQLQDNPAFVRPMFTEFINSSLGPLQGASAEIIMNEMEHYGEQWNFLSHVDALKNKKLLLVGAKRDQVTPVFDHHMPLAKALKVSDSVTSKLIASDHVYSGNRVELARILLDWLA